MSSNTHSIQWKSLPWKKFQRKVFRLQQQIWKAIRDGDKAAAVRFQKLLLKSRSAKWLAIRQVSQLNLGKKTAGVDRKKALTFKDRLNLISTLTAHYKNWKHQGLREVPIPKKDGTKRILKIPTISDRAWQCLCKLAIEPAHEATFHARSYGFRPGRSPYDGDVVYWSKRESKLYDGATAKVLKRQGHTCQACGLALMPGDKVELHHRDGNHNNWKPNNLEARHSSCHHYHHMSRATAWANQEP